uniref:Uncharacterized protein n=1 Tax=Meloidogyne hapla TaxID=6305 RepID=A0A1I8BU85_MELHA
MWYWHNRCESVGDYCYVKRIDVNIFELSTYSYWFRNNLERGCGKCKDSKDCFDYYCAEKDCDKSVDYMTDKGYHKCHMGFHQYNSFG